jgi:hypothetical protein
MDWKPATIEEVSQIVQRDLPQCDSEQREALRPYAVAPYAAPIIRYGQPETVVVVARKDSETIYWEDVEGGFNSSPIGSDGTILEHWCNQDQLGQALDFWMPGRHPRDKIGPAQASP